MEGERDPERVHDCALNGLIPATTWREAGETAAVSSPQKMQLGDVGRNPLRLIVPVNCCRLFAGRTADNTLLTIVKIGLIPAQPRCSFPGEGKG
jgi:hypothetical protein